GPVYLVPNVVPFSGSGRLNTPAPAGLTLPTTNPPAPWTSWTDALLVNYTYYPIDGILRDPERYPYRTTAGAVPPPPANPASEPITGGINVPYTYPDHNNMFLAAINAGGQVLTPSFHRKWLFNPANLLNDPTNPNWTNQIGKYFTLRPRPVEQLTQTQVQTY